MIADLALFTGILLIVALGLYVLSCWHARIDKRLRPQSRYNQRKRGNTLQPNPKKRANCNPSYPTISRADLEMEAAATEAGYFELHDHILHVNKFRGRHHDSA